MRRELRAHLGLAASVSLRTASAKSHPAHVPQAYPPGASIAT